MAHVDALDRLLNTWILNAHSPTEQKAAWGIKLRAKALLQWSSTPDALAARMVTVLLRHDAASWVDAA